MNAGYPPIVVYKENKEAYFNAIEKSLNKKPKNYYHFMLEQSDKTYDYLLQTIGKY
jgi:hypothetical protein